MTITACKGDEPLNKTISVFLEHPVSGLTIVKSVMEKVSDFSKSSSGFLSKVYLFR